VSQCFRLRFLTDRRDDKQLYNRLEQGLIILRWNGAEPALDTLRCKDTQDFGGDAALAGQESHPRNVSDFSSPVMPSFNSFSA
jgi:hypothetical protein